MIGQYPFVDGRLTDEVIGLLADVALGSMALRCGRSKAVRVGAFVAALAVFGYNVSVVLTRDPRGVLVLYAVR